MINISDQDKKKALDEAFKLIEKQYGKGAVMVLGDEQVKKIDAIPTGAINLDLALGIGGIPRGRIIEIYGPESSGKTTLSLHILAEAQKLGGVAAFIDAEHALDIQYAKKLGVDVDNLIISQPDTGEQGVDIVDSLVRSNAVDIVIVDSVAALVPRAEIEGDMNDAQMGLHARLMSKALRRLTGAISKSKATIVFINQLREKIGNPYGNPETTTGGRALKFYSSVRLDIRKVEVLKEGENAVGNKVKVKVVKNKVAPPFKTVEFDIMYGEGISKLGTILDLAADYDIIKKAGSWYSYESEKIGQGREKAKAFLKENPNILEEVEKKLYAKLDENNSSEDEKAKSKK